MSLKITISKFSLLTFFFSFMLIVYVTIVCVFFLFFIFFLLKGKLQGEASLATSAKEIKVDYIQNLARKRIRPFATMGKGVTHRGEGICYKVGFTKHMLDWENFKGPGQLLNVLNESTNLPRDTGSASDAVHNEAWIAFNFNLE